MRQLRVTSICVAVGLLAACSVLRAQQPQQEPESVPAEVRIVESIDDSRLVTLAGNTHPLARPEFDRGRVDPSLPMSDLVLVLRRSPERQAAFDAFVAGQYDPQSPHFHQWLSPQDVGERFGPAQSDVDAVSNWLKGHGFSIDEQPADRLSIRFSGTAAQVESAFHAEMRHFDVKNLRSGQIEPHIANQRDPQIPQALAPLVVGVKALHNFFPRPLHRLGPQVVRDSQSGGWHRLPAGDSAPLPGPAPARRPLPEFGTTDINGNPVEDVAPYDFAAIYNVLPAWQAASPIDGTGQTIAIAGTSNINLADVATFRKAFGLPANVPKVTITNSDPGVCPTFANTCSGDLIENTLDVEWSGAVAKGASIVLVTSSAPTASTDALYLSESYIVHHATAPVMNVSYGACELALGTAGNTEYSNLWQTAASEGIAVIVASGDSGSPACDQGYDAVYGVPYAAQYGLSVSGLASTPYDTAIGGTDFNWGSTPSPYWNASNTAGTGASAAGYIPEVPWNSTCANPLILPALESDASFIGVSGVGDAESACNFVVQYAQYIYDYYGVDLSSLVDTVGGGGGASNCTVSASTGTVSSCSVGYVKPAWQAGVAGIPADKVRDIPDLSFFASDGFLGSAYLICVSGGGNTCSYSASAEPIAQEVGGTSVASPAMAGVMALVNQKTGFPQGSPNATLYALAAKQNYGACSAEKATASGKCIFNDIDSGTNSMPCQSGSPNCTVIYSGDPAGMLSLNPKATSDAVTAFSATRGYDQATGLGSVDVANLVNNWPNTAPIATLSPTSLTFAATAVGKKSATQSVILKNTGKSPLNLSGTGLGISIAGKNASSFTQTNTCGASVAAATSCIVTITFAPASAGALAASLNVADNATGSPQTVALSGTGVTPTPAVTLSTQTVAFAGTAIGKSSAAPKITLTNSGTAALALTGLTLAGTGASSFSEVNTCAKSLPAAASCTITITFKPLAAGKFAATLSVTDNATGSPQKIALTGTGTGPVVSLSPAALTFAATTKGTSAPAKKVTVTNKGNAALSFSGAGLGITLKGANATSFSQTNTCGTSLAAGTACVLTVTFKPTATGSLAATVNLADSAYGSPQKVTLTGTGK